MQCKVWTEFAISSQSKSKQVYTTQITLMNRNLNSFLSPQSQSKTTVYQLFNSNAKNRSENKKGFFKGYNWARTDI